MALSFLRADVAGHEHRETIEGMSWPNQEQEYRTEADVRTNGETHIIEHLSQR